MTTPKFSLATTLAVVFFSILFFHPATAQKEANNWYFGFRSGVSFASGAPVPLTGGAIDAFEGCASFSDANGNLLFYTNGGGAPLGLIPNGARDGIIWNRNHQVMYNMGANEGGGYSSAQSALIVPKPGSASQYYLFTMDQYANLNNPANRGLSYFVVDMSLNGGLGGVSVANQPIYTPAVECQTAFRHANGTDLWIVTIDPIAQHFVIVPVTGAGVQSPIIDINLTTSESLVIKASPNGEFLCAANRIYRFNRATGQLTLLANLPQASNYSFSFSPESRYLYTTNADLTGDAILRYDLTATNIPASQQTVAGLGFSFGGGMQIAPDGNIYFLEQTEDLSLTAQVGLSAIRCPDAVSPTFERSVLVFDTEPGTDWVVGLPNFPDFLFDNLFNTDTLTDDLVFCEGTNVTLDAGFANAAYLWSNGATTPTITVNTAGLYSVTVTNECGKVLAVHNFNLQALEDGKQVEDTLTFTLCPGVEIPLTGKPGADTYLWSNGATTPAIDISSPGTYSVTATFGCAEVVSPFSVDGKSIPAVSLKISDSTTPCPGETVTLTATSADATTFLWSNGEITPSIQAAAGEVYAVTVTNTCGQGTASLQVPVRNCCNVYVPNAFSPNNDGFNDVFVPFFSGCDITNYRFTVFSRWGEKVFDSNNPEVGWDGSFKGKKMPAGVFVWQLTYLLNSVEGPSQELRAGDVMVLY